MPHSYNLRNFGGGRRIVYFKCKNRRIGGSISEQTAYLVFTNYIRRLDALQVTHQDAETQTPSRIDIGTQMTYLREGSPAPGQIPLNPASPTSSGSTPSKSSSPSNPRSPIPSNPASPTTSSPSPSPKRSPFLDLPITRSPRPLANDLALLQTPPPELSRTAVPSEYPSW